MERQRVEAVVAVVAVVVAMVVLVLVLVLVVSLFAGLFFVTCAGTPNCTGPHRSHMQELTCDL